LDGWLKSDSDKHQSLTGAKQFIISQLQKNNKININKTANELVEYYNGSASK